MLAWIIGIHLLEANLLNPKIIGTAAKMHPVVVVFALMVGEETGGLIGALLAVPIASMVQAIFLYFRRRQPLEAAAPTPTSS
jgi:predicted PurR-regulated permease PerM